MGLLAIGAQAQHRADTLMTEKTHEIKEVVVTSHNAQQRHDNVQISQEKITMAEIERLPAFMGEKDVMKSLQLLPGIKSENEASSGFQVRGGKSSQNLVLLDNATIYQAGHLLGIFSSFNDNALSQATLSKGMIPAQYGNATSSVLSIATKHGDMDTYHYGGTIGLLSAKAYVEGPIAKDKASFLVTARRSYMDMFFNANERYKNTELYFYDINARVDWKASQRDNLSLSFFHGKDVLGMKDVSDMNWLNTSLTLAWTHHHSRKLTASTSLFLSHFSSGVSMEGFGMDYEQSGFTKQYGLNHNYTWTPMQGLSVNMGLQTDLIDLRSAEWRIASFKQYEERKAWENGVWVNGVWDVSKAFSLSAGVRFNTFTVLGGAPYYDVNEDGDITNVYNPASGSFVKTYGDVEPRFSANWKLNESSCVKFGYSYTTQNVHAIRSNMSMPFDRYTMSSNILKPEKAHQWSVGYNRSFLGGAYDLSVESYYKATDNVYDYRDGKTFRSEIEIERLLLGGKSRSYGAEFSFHKNTGALTGWVNYTLSWVDNKIDGINNGDWYTASNDRRHDITIVAMYKLNDHWDFSASWKYTTGQALTAPTAKYQLDGRYYYYYSGRNNYRSPSNHRLDISASYTKHHKNHDGIWTFGIYNLYNRMNPFIVGFRNDKTKASGVQAYQIALFGIIPSVSYTIKY